MSDLHIDWATGPDRTVVVIRSFRPDGSAHLEPLRVSDIPPEVRRRLGLDGPRPPE